MTCPACGLRLQVFHCPCGGTGFVEPTDAPTYPLQPEPLPDDGTVAALRAENERLKAGIDATLAFLDELADSIICPRDNTFRQEATKLRRAREAIR